MNILLINHYAGSPEYGMEYRPYYMSREWVRQGHNVQILAASQSHVRTKSPNLNGEKNAFETINNIKYLWFATPTYTGNGIKRIMNIATFIQQLFKNSKKIVSTFKPDIVIASSTYPMDIWPAHHIAKLAKAKLIYEVHDLWPLSPMELGGMSKYHPFIMLVQRAEDYAYRHSELIVSMLPNASEYMQSRGMKLSKFRHIPNGYDNLEKYNDTLGLPTNLAVEINLAKKNNRFIVGYAGSHGIPNGLDNLLNTASLSKHLPISYFLIGNGHERERLLNRIVNEKLDNVKMFPAIPKNVVSIFLNKIDIGYLGSPKSSLYNFGVSPNKMLDYMANAVPILYAIDSGNHPILDAKCGIEVKADDPSALLEGILILKNSSTLAEMGENGKVFASKNYTYTSLSKKFIDVIATI